MMGVDETGKSYFVATENHLFRRDSQVFAYLLDLIVPDRDVVSLEDSTIRIHCHDDVHIFDQNSTHASFLSNGWNQPDSVMEYSRGIFPDRIK